MGMEKYMGRCHATRRNCRGRRNFFWAISEN